MARDGTKTGGDEKAGKKYALNIRNSLAKIAHDYITGDGVKSLLGDLDALRPVDRATVMEKYLKYFLPTMGSMQIGQSDDGDPVKIVVTYSTTDPASIDDDESEQDYSEEI